MNQNKKRSIWSIELILVIGLPATAVIAGLTTLAIAITHPYGVIEHGVDRWSQPHHSSPAR